MFIKTLLKKKLAIGDAAPLFSLPNQRGETVHLADYIGRKNIVLYFYPKDNTYGCIVESSEFRDHYPLFLTKDAEVIGVSSDTPESHEAFAKKYNLPFQLLSDPKNLVRRLYKVPTTLGVIPGRVTFIIDKKGVIRHIFNSQFQPHSHVEEALKHIEESAD